MRRSAQIAISDSDLLLNAATYYTHMTQHNVFVLLSDVTRRNFANPFPVGCAICMITTITTSCQIKLWNILVHMGLPKGVLYISLFHFTAVFTRTRAGKLK